MAGNDSLSSSTSLIDYLIFINVNELLDSMAEIEYFAHAIILPIVLSIGFINQCINIATLLRLPPGGFVYLKASALCDIFSIIFLIPFVVRLAGVTNTSSPSLMWYHAHLELTIANAFLGLSALCIVAMTVDRYLSVCHPIHFFNNVDSRSDSNYRSLRIVSLLFLVTFIVQMPTALQKEVKWNNITNVYEIERSPIEKHVLFKAYIIFRELITKIGPMIIIVLLNLLMVDALRKMHRNNWRSTTTSQLRDRPQTERFRISVLLTVTSVTFVICNLPATLLHIFIDKTEKDSVFWQSFRAAANILETSAYLFNFYLYALCSSDYREALIGLLICRPTRNSRMSSPKKMATFARQRETLCRANLFFSSASLCDWPDLFVMCDSSVVVDDSSDVFTISGRRTDRIHLSVVNETQNG